LRAVTSAQCGLRATQRRVARFAGLEDFRAVPLAASRILLGANAKEYSGQHEVARDLRCPRAYPSRLPLSNPQVRERQRHVLTRVAVAIVPPSPP
jgi:hypothetical protein